MKTLLPLPSTLRILVRGAELNKKTNSRIINLKKRFPQHHVNQHAKTLNACLCTPSSSVRRWTTDTATAIAKTPSNYRRQYLQSP